MTFKTIQKTRFWLLQTLQKTGFPSGHLTGFVLKNVRPTQNTVVVKVTELTSRDSQ